MLFRSRGQQLGDQCGIADVTVGEDVAGVAFQAGQVLEIAGVGQFIEINDRLVTARQPVEHKIGADESRPAGDQNQILKSSSVFPPLIAAESHLGCLPRPVQVMPVAESRYFGATIERLSAPAEFFFTLGLLVN